MQPGVYSVVLYNLQKYTLVENNSERLPEDFFVCTYCLVSHKKGSPHTYFLNASFVFIIGMHSCFVWFKKLSSINCFWLHMFA